MFINAEELAPDEALQADVLVIGAGPAGVTLAMELAGRGRDVLVLESGRVERDPKDDELGHAEMEGYLQPAHFNIHAARHFGGATSVWGGVCAVLDAFVYRARPGAMSPWLLTGEDLADYYDRAGVYLKLPAAASQAPERAMDSAQGIRVKRFHRSPARYGELYADTVRANGRIRCILGAVARRFPPVDSDDAIAHVEFVDSQGRRREARGRFIVLAGGALSNARMMLEHARERPRPGTGWDHVGRWFMEHPHFYNGVASGRMTASAMGEVVVAGDRAVIPAIRLEERLQEDAGLLATSYEVLSSGQPQGLYASFDAVMAGEEMFDARFILRGEMEARYENRIELREGEDRSGAPLARGVLNLSEADLASANASVALLTRTLNRAGAGRFARPDGELTAAGAFGGGHLMGVTRMGADPADSVVDGNVRVHDYDNLYVAGSSVFPSGGASNPTFTIVALAIRLADHLEQRLTEELGG